MSNGESTVSNASISQRAEALEKAEKEAAAKPEEKKVEEVKTEEPVKKEEVKPEVKTEVKTEEKKVETKVEKKAPNDPDELRKWNTRVAQENKKLRDEIAAVKEAQDKTFKLLSSISKKPVDYKELAKDPEKLQKFIEDERENATAELREQLDKVSNDARSKETALERMRREQDTENYPEWKRLYPQIVKLAMGPSGTGDPRVDFTKSAGEVLDQLYVMALEENPKSAETPKPEVPAEKTFTESEMKAMLADMLAKEKEAIAKSAKDEALKDAQRDLSEEMKGGTVASAGKGAGRIPSDALSAFKKMSLNEQREWLIAQQDK